MPTDCISFLKSCKSGLNCSVFLFNFAFFYLLMNKKKFQTSCKPNKQSASLSPVTDNMLQNLRSRDNYLVPNYNNNNNLNSLQQPSDKLSDRYNGEKYYKQNIIQLSNKTKYIIYLTIIIVILIMIYCVYWYDNDNKVVPLIKIKNLYEIHDWVSAFDSLIPSSRKQPKSCDIITDCDEYGCNEYQYSMEYSDENQDDEDDTEIIEWESMKYYEDKNHWKALHDKQNMKLINMEGCPLVFIGGRIQSGWWNYLQITNKLHQHCVIYAIKDSCIQDVGWRLFNNMDKLQNGWSALQMCTTTNIILNIASNDIINGETLDVILNELNVLLYQIEIMSKNIVDPLHISIVGLLPHTHDICKTHDKYNKWDKGNKYFIINNAVNMYLANYVERYQEINDQDTKQLSYAYVDCTKYFLENIKMDVISDNFNNKYQMFTGDLTHKYMQKYFDLNEEGYKQFSRCLIESKSFDVKGFESLIKPDHA